LGVEKYVVGEKTGERGRRDVFILFGGKRAVCQASRFGNVTAVEVRGER
jgi:hypothetical protein